MSKPFTTLEKKQLRRRTEEIVRNASAAQKKVTEKPVGRAAPQPRIGSNNTAASSPYNARNGDIKSPPSRPTSAANSKPPAPWQRPKVTPASAVYGNKEPTNYLRPTSASAARRVNAGPANSGTKPGATNNAGSKPGPTNSAGSKPGPTNTGSKQSNSSVSNTPGIKPSAVNSRNRARAASSAVNSSSPTPHSQSKDSNKDGPRVRSTSTPFIKETKDTASKKPAMHDKVSSNSPVSYKAGESVVLPKLEKTDATLETKKPEPTGKPPAGDEKLLAPPRRSRAHVMPAAKTAKPLKKGHDFAPHELTDWVNWCDACGSIILSLFGKCVKCKKCMMVCHGKCASTVSLTCEADEIRAASQIDPAWYKTIVEETKDESTLKEYNTIHRVMPIGEIKERIEKFNKTVKSTQQMTLQEDGETFRGFIRVTMNLTRPVSVGSEENQQKDRKKLQRSASFYVNKGAVKALYLSSNTTAEEVVSALLNKYGIKDNPLKFALFEKQVREEGHIILRKMMTRERPLFLRLLWGDGSTQQHAFILQENESREIQWESFSLPELYTFLKILEKEQNDHITCIKVKFDGRRQDILKAMEFQKKKTGK